MQQSSKATSVSRFHDAYTLPRQREGWVLVFGSNERGVHGSGIAKTARTVFGAVNGMSRGRQGSAYAVPVTGRRQNSNDPSAALPYEAIAMDIADFLTYASNNPGVRFWVTPLVSEKAHGDSGKIASLFASAPSNCSLPDTWSAFLTT